MEKSSLFDSWESIEAATEEDYERHFKDALASYFDSKLAEYIDKNREHLRTLGNEDQAI